MTKTHHHPEQVHKIVVFADCCSSTTIVDDLLLSGNGRLWRDFIIDLKEHVEGLQLIYSFEVYKFLGDGWIFLFDPEDDPNDHFAVLRALKEHYQVAFKKRLSSRLNRRLKSSGITMGLDSGPLIKLTMNEQVEYVGRPLNVAARLQSAIKDRDERPAGKILMSRAAYQELSQDGLKLGRVRSTSRVLRNIEPAEFRCVKVRL